MAIQGIDLAALTLQDALDLAVLVEEEARDRYQELAAQLEAHHTPDAGAFFRKMVKVEELHRSSLEERRRERFGSAPVRVSRALLFDVEAPEYDAARAGMSRAAALQAALACEVKAHDFFAAALGVVRDPEVRELFDELRAEELEHQRWLRAEMDRLPPLREVPGDVSDEPVAL